MPPPGRFFDFLTYGERYKCTCRSVKYTLRKESESKNNEADADAKMEGNMLFTTSVLQRVFSKNKIVSMLRCECRLCWPMTEHTPPEQDKQLADVVTGNTHYQMLLGALAFMGGTFAVRHLHKDEFHTIEKTLDLMHKRMDLQEKLFESFRDEWSEERCPHKIKHKASHPEDAVACLGKQFVSQLRSAAWIVRTPYFQANNLSRRFTERQNQPFINQIQLNAGAPDVGRRYFKFEIHPGYCDDKLNGRVLFRKQLLLQTEKAREEVHRESQILEYLKELGNPNIAEVLFAFQEEYPPSFSLVFDYHPTDLFKVLYGQQEQGFVPPDKPPDRFPGSILDDWRWIGVLGVFDAVAAVHEPQKHSQSIPESATSKFLGAHFDIKPGNIVIDQNGRFLLTDFGHSYFKTVKIGQEANFTIPTHTLNYRPPPSYSKSKTVENVDNVEGKKWWTQAYDVWSLACVCVEVVASIVEGQEAASLFHEERVQEDDSGLGNFWKTVNEVEMLKVCVKDRLVKYQTCGDEYLARVARHIEQMFQIQKKELITVKASHRELSASVRVDRYLFRGRKDIEIAGERTYRPLQTMRTSFSTERVSEMRCSLYLWANQNKTTLTIEFAGSEEQKIIAPYTCKTAGEEIIPISLFDGDVLFERNRFRTNGPFLQCAFRSMHDGILFHFAKLADYNHFFGAVTHQRICTGSSFRIKGCRIEEVSSKWDVSSKMQSRARSALDGHIQIWEDLRAEDYAARYRNPRKPVIVTPQSSTPRSPVQDDSSSLNTSLKIPPVGPAEKAIGYFRLVLFLRMNNSFMIAVVSLNDDTFRETFDERKKLMRLERKSGPKIFAATYERQAESASSPPAGLRARPDVDDFPGVPLSSTVLAEDIEKQKGLKRLEVDFWSSDDLKKFREFCKSLTM